MLTDDSFSRYSDRNAIRFWTGHSYTNRFACRRYSMKMTWLCKFLYEAILKLGMLMIMSQHFCEIIRQKLCSFSDIHRSNNSAISMQANSTMRASRVIKQGSCSGGWPESFNFPSLVKNTTLCDGSIFIKHNQPRQTLLITLSASLSLPVSDIFRPIIIIFF